MQLSESDINAILSDFPKFELSYETMTHNKVCDADVILAIPEGQNYFAWFTSYKNNNVCFILEITENKQISNIEIVQTSFVDKLAFGTIFYGSIFYYNKMRAFCVEDIYYYRGRNIYRNTYLEKLNLLGQILNNDVSSYALNKNFMIFGLPLIKNDFSLLLKEIELLPYKIKFIKFRYLNKDSSSNIFCMKYFKPSITNKCAQGQLNKAVFKITPALQEDIYNLFIYNKGTEDFYDVAFIPDFKTSVMMNKLFRNIKENYNLDALEESDDEDEFECEREDKFVFMDRSFKMNCEYNYKFKKWFPVSLAEKNEKIITYNLLKNSVNIKS